MIIVMKPGAPVQECEKIKNGLINNGFQINEIVGVNMTILGVIGDTSTLDINLLRQQADENNQANRIISGSVNINDKSRNAISEEAEATEVVKKVKVSSDYFNTLAENEKEANLIKAIIDEDVKATDGTRIRLRLLDDVEIGELVVPKGSYLYATMSGFGSQRVKGNIKSMLIDDELVKINLSIYDTDGMEGLYVPSSSFRETTKDVASSAASGNMEMNKVLL